MYKQYGESMFSVLIHENDKPMFLNECNLWKEYLTNVAEYKIVTKDNDYYFCLVRAEDYHRDGKELCKFMLRHIPFIAMRQEESSFIMVNDKTSFRQALEDIYKDKEHKQYFLYDMLTANERYVLTTLGLPQDAAFMDLQFIHEDPKTGCIYQLNLEPETPYIYQEESLLDIIDNYTGEKIDVDIVDYISQVIFHIVILDKKLEKN